MVFPPLKNCLFPWNLEKCNILMIIFYHWGRNLNSWASDARVCWRAPVQYLPQLGLFDPEIEISIRKWFQKALYTDALVFCVPCRRNSRETMLLNIWAVTGMHFPNHLTSQAYLCLNAGIWTLVFWWPLICTGWDLCDPVPCHTCPCASAVVLTAWEVFSTFSVCLWVAFRLWAHASGGD